jgi:hypothetical protein
MRQLVRLGLAVFWVVISPLVSSATVIGACETDLPGVCTKSVDINPAGTQFTIVLTNTSDSANGGFITADAFSLPGDLGATLATTGTSFTLVSGAVKVAPINIDREFLLTTDSSPNPNNSFEGGGNPNSGIAAGSTLIFVFDITGGTLTDSLDNELSILNSQVIRFRGFADGGSDKDTITSSATPVPEAASFILFATGLVALCYILSRFNVGTRSSRDAQPRMDA